MPAKPKAAPVKRDAARDPDVFDDILIDDDPSLDEALFVAELRRAVEGTRTPAEELLARDSCDWGDRLDRIFARYGA